jgi:hypothetical protein
LHNYLLFFYFENINLLYEFYKTPFCRTRFLEQTSAPNGL